MTKAWLAFGVGDTFGFRLEGLRRGFWVRAINIKLETCHDVEVVPKLVLEIVDVAQVREELTHYADDGVGDAVALFAVGYRFGVVNHVVDVAAVLRND